MKKLSRIIVVILVLIMAFGVTACKDKTTKKSAPTIIGESEFTFLQDDKQDITIKVDLKGKSLSSLKLGDDIVATNNYTVAASDITLKKGYLGVLSAGSSVFTITTDGGTCTFTIKIVAGQSTEFVRPNYKAELYNNRDYNEFLSKENVTIKGQWDGYGIGDPFVMRFDGSYYLYASTLDAEKGVRAWKSDDLFSWEQVTGEGLATGYVSEDPVTRAAYAPEVYYYDGTFYMYSSSGGNGHYVLSSSSPAGPFVAATENLGLSIDGSVFFDDDEKMYFTRAENGGIRLHKMNSMTDIAAGSYLLDNTNIGGWTEGSYILKRDGKYYITYTGNNVGSDSYRISYAVSEKNTSLYSRSFFETGINNPIALETSNDFRGLGHSSTVLGPDMDSYYLAYHSLNSSGGPNRSYNLDRLTFNGTQMSVKTKLDGSIKPTLPAFTANAVDANKFDVTDGVTISKVSTKANFTAEYNVTNINDAKMIFDYVNAQNYSYVSVNVTAKTIDVKKVVAGVEQSLASATLNNTYNNSILHTVRISSRDGKLDVVFDNMTKIDNASVTTTGGKIGYILNGATASYTAFSNVAMGMSDEQEIKQSGMQTGSSLYETSANYIAKPYELTSGSGVSDVREADSKTIFEGAKELKLANAGNYVTYLNNFDTTDFYGLELIYDKAYAGKTIGISVDSTTGMRITLPAVETEEQFVKALITELDIKAGINQIRFECIGDPFAFISFGFIKTSKNTPIYSQSLASYALTGSDYKTIWKLKDDGHYAKAGTRQLVYFGDNTLTDFTLEVEMKLEGATQTSTAGIVVRAGNYAASSHDNFQSIQAYYISFNNANSSLNKLGNDISRMNIGIKLLKNDSDAFFKVKIVARGNSITVYKNDVSLYTVSDALAYNSGRVGLYTNGAAVVYKNLKISA